MGKQHTLDGPGVQEEKVVTGYEKHEARRAAMLVIISQRFNLNVDDVLAKVRYMSLEENVDEITALKRYRELAEEGRDPYPNVRARVRR